jgi:protein TonB
LAASVVLHAALFLLLPAGTFGGAREAPVSRSLAWQERVVDARAAEFDPVVTEEPPPPPEDLPLEALPPPVEETLEEDVEVEPEPSFPSLPTEPPGPGLLPDPARLAGVPVRRPPVFPAVPAGPVAASPRAPPVASRPVAHAPARRAGPLRPTVRARPAYPPDLQRAGIEGVAVVRVVVEEDGTVSDASIARTSGHAGFDEAAVASLRAWRFEPPGRRVRTDVSVRFRLT